MKRSMMGLVVALVCTSAWLGTAIAKRKAPTPVKPVVHSGVKYAAPHFLPKKEQPGGFVQALDEKTGKLLWEVKVYEIQYDKKKERDVQDVFITTLEIVDKSKLLVTDEKGDQYEVDLKTKAVTKREPPKKVKKEEPPKKVKKEEPPKKVKKEETPKKAP